MGQTGGVTPKKALAPKENAKLATVGKNYFIYITP